MLVSYDVHNKLVLHTFLYRVAFIWLCECHQWHPHVCYVSFESIWLRGPYLFTYIHIYIYTYMGFMWEKTKKQKKIIYIDIYVRALLRIDIQYIPAAIVNGQMLLNCCGYLVSVFEIVLCWFRLASTSRICISLVVNPGRDVVFEVVSFAFVVVGLLLFCLGFEAWKYFS